MEANQSSPKKRNCYKTLVLENIKYKTRFTAKFSNRKKYEPRNPKKLTAFIPGLIKDITVKAGSKVKENDKLIMKRDYLFSSSSSAAMIIMGRSANGLTEWKMKSGKTLQEFETGENN